MQNIKFSIICATYNAGQNLHITLNSVLNQTYNSSLIEMIVVDGKSNDNTLEILKNYEAKFNGRLKYISEKDSGIYNAFNKGVALASGDFINFQGSGDSLMPSALQEVANVLQDNSVNTNAVAVQGFVRLIENNQTKQRAIYDDLYAMRSDKTIRCHHQAFFYTRELHALLGNYNEEYRLASDYDFALKIVASGAMVANVSQILANFEVGGASFTNKRLLDDEVARSRCEVLGEQYKKECVLCSRLLKLVKLCLPWGIVKLIWK